MHIFTQNLKASRLATSVKSTKPGRTDFVQHREVNSIIHSQRTIGNHAVQRLQRSNAEEFNAVLTGTASPNLGFDFSRIPITSPRTGVIQAKLAINKPGDEYELEADRVAEYVMRMPEPRLQSACPFGGGWSLCQRDSAGKTQKIMSAGTGTMGDGPRRTLKTGIIQTKLTNGASRDEYERDADRISEQVVCMHDSPPRLDGIATQQEPENKNTQINGARQVSVHPAVHKVLHSPGRPLDPNIRGFMEPRFARDFSQVRMHTGRLASDSANAVSARAYTVGNHIVFGKQEFSPATQGGRRLIAHELAHVVQQDATTRPQLQRVAWHPTRADERITSNADRFASQTFELDIPSLTGLGGRTSTQNIRVSVFVPSGAVPSRNKVHVFFSPGAAAEGGLAPTQLGLNAVMTHGLRGASDSTEWILIGVPGRAGARSEDNGFNTIDTSGIQACLHAAGRRTTHIDALRLSAHSRGFRGLRETITRHLISGQEPERVVIFDAAYGSVDRALRHSGISGRNMVAFNVVTSHRLSAHGAKNISLPASAMRAIGYSRVILDAMTIRPSLVIPSAIRSQLLPLPPRGLFTTASPAPAGMTNIIDFARAHRVEIHRIDHNRDNASTGLKHFIDSNNLLLLGMSFTAGIDAHHLFVAELAHEVTD